MKEKANLENLLELIEADIARARESARMLPARTDWFMGYEDGCRHCAGRIKDAIHK
jgi:hypothetical protein